MINDIKIFISASYIINYTQLYIFTIIMGNKQGGEGGTEYKEEVSIDFTCIMNWCKEDKLIWNSYLKLFYRNFPQK